MSYSRRRFSQSLLALLALGGLPPAQARELVEGRDWVPINPPQPGAGDGRIEVLEFFSYGCSHCADMNPLIKPWAKRLPEGVTFQRVPVSFGRAAWANLARLYLALEATGDLERLDQAVFDALHKQRANLYTPDLIFDWVAARGVDAKAFAGIFNSFAVSGRLSRSDQLVRAYGVDAVPRITVAGRYSVTGEGARSLEDLLSIAEALIGRAQAEAGGRA